MHFVYFTGFINLHVLAYSVVMCFYKWPENCKPKPAAPGALELRQPSQTISVGKTVKASVNILTSRKGLIKSVCSELEDKVHQFASAPATRQQLKYDHI